MGASACIYGGADKREPREVSRDSSDRPEQRIERAAPKRDVPEDYVFWSELTDSAVRRDATRTANQE